MRPDPATTCASVLDATARGLRAGLSLPAALEAACTPGRPVPVVVATALARHHRGDGLSEALRAARCTVDSRGPDPGAEMLALDVLTLAAQEGGVTAEALDRAANALRERATVRADARVQAASARLSARVMTVTPLVFSVAAALLDARVRRVLVTSPVCWVSTSAGVALNAAGRVWMARIVTAADRVPGWPQGRRRWT